MGAGLLTTWYLRDDLIRQWLKLTQQLMKIEHRLLKNSLLTIYYRHDVTMRNVMSRSKAVVSEKTHIVMQQFSPLVPIPLLCFTCSRYSCTRKNPDTIWYELEATEMASRDLTRHQGDDCTGVSHPACSRQTVVSRKVADVGTDLTAAKSDHFCHAIANAIASHRQSITWTSHRSSFNSTRVGSDSSASSTIALDHRLVHWIVSTPS